MGAFKLVADAGATVVGAGIAVKRPSSPAAPAPRAGHAGRVSGPDQRHGRGRLHQFC